MTRYVLDFVIGLAIVVGVVNTYVALRTPPQDAPEPPAAQSMPHFKVGMQ